MFSEFIHSIDPIVTMKAALLYVLPFVALSNAFAPTLQREIRPSTQLFFGIPSFLTPKNDKEEDKQEKKDDKKIGLSGIVQLITAGAGAPFLGDFQGVDKETGKFMFSLEANNLVDENGESKQTKMPYFESGWVDPEEEERARKRREDGFKFPWQK